MFDFWHTFQKYFISEYKEAAGKQHELWANLHHRSLSIQDFWAKSKSKLIWYLTVILISGCLLATLNESLNIFKISKQAGTLKNITSIQFQFECSDHILTFSFLKQEWYQKPGLLTANSFLLASSFLVMILILLISEIENDSQNFVTISQFLSPFFALNFLPQKQKLFHFLLNISVLHKPGTFSNLIVSTISMCQKILLTIKSMPNLHINIITLFSQFNCSPYFWLLSDQYVNIFKPIECCVVFIQSLSFLLIFSYSFCQKDFTL